MSDKKDNEQEYMQKRTDLKMKNIKEFGLFSYEMECKREESLIEQSGKMMTAFSIYTASLYVLVQIMLDCFRYLKNEILLATGIISICLIASLVLAVISQWRYKYKRPRIPNRTIIHLINHSKNSALFSLLFFSFSFCFR